MRKLALAEIAHAAPDSDALTKFWPMALRNDKAIILAALAVTKDKKQTFELAGQALQSDSEVRSAAGVEGAPEGADDEETGRP